MGHAHTPLTPFGSQGWGAGVPRSPEDRRLKDDRRDARLLLDAVTAPAGKCRRVYVPSEEAEAARDLCRAHADMVASPGLAL